MNYLRPNIKRGNYTQEEDQLILKMHRQLGNKYVLSYESEKLSDQILTTKVITNQ